MLDIRLEARIAAKIHNEEYEGPKYGNLILRMDGANLVIPVEVAIEKYGYVPREGE